MHDHYLLLVCLSAIDDKKEDSTPDGRKHH